jgi:hypothetical protein
MPYMRDSFRNTLEIWHLGNIAVLWDASNKWQEVLAQDSPEDILMTTAMTITITEIRTKIDLRSLKRISPSSRKTSRRAS